MNKQALESYKTTMINLTSNNKKKTREKRRKVWVIPVSHTTRCERWVWCKRIQSRDFLPGGGLDTMEAIHSAWPTELKFFNLSIKFAWHCVAITYQGRVERKSLCSPTNSCWATGSCEGESRGQCLRFWTNKHWQLDSVLIIELFNGSRRSELTAKN